MSASSGTVAAMHSVMLGLRRAAANIAGGTHHAFSGHGEGFCEVLLYIYLATIGMLYFIFLHILYSIDRLY